MTALNFPNNPNVGDVFTVGDKSWTWTGKAWAVVRTQAQGASAYDLAVKNGFVGTEAQWIASLKGTTGDTGPQGPAGTAGSAGPKGDPGTPGAKGADGISGTNGAGVPAGGGTGQVLQKNSNGDFDTKWVTPEYLTDYTVPLGGNQGQFLGKSSGEDGDFHWLNLPAQAAALNELPAGGNTGQILTKNSPSQGDVSWQDAPNASGVPDGGTAGQVLTKNTETNGDVSWQVPQTGIAEAPVDGNMYARQSASWVPFSPGSGGSGGSSDATNVFGTDTGPVGRVTGVTPHRFWRIYSKTENGGENYISYSNVQFRANAGAVTQNVGGTVLSSGHYADSIADLAFDADPTSSYISDNNLPNWIGYAFATAIPVVEISLTNRYDGYGYQAPTDFDVQWSDDGNTWTTEWSVSDVDWSNTAHVTKLFENTSSDAANVSQKYPTKLAALNDVSDSMPTNGQSLTWNSTSQLWTPTSGAGALAGLSDVDVTTNRPIDGQVLEYNSTSGRWIPGTASSGSSAGGIGSDLGDLQTAIAAKTAIAAVTTAGELTSGNKIDSVVDKGGLVGMSLFSNTSNSYTTRDTGSVYVVPDGCVAICFGGKADLSVRENTNYYATRLYNVTQSKIVGSFISSGDATRVMGSGWYISYLGGLMSNSSGGGPVTYDYPITGVAGDQIRVENWTSGDGNYRMVNAEYYLIIVDATTGVQLDVTGNVNSDDIPNVSGNAGKALVVDSTGSHTQWSPMANEAPNDGNVYARQNNQWVAISENVINNNDVGVLIPQLVQSAYGRGTGTATATFTGSAKAGNTIFLVISGYASAKVAPSGFTYHSGGAYTANQSVYTYFRVADGTESKTFTVTGGDNINLAVYEIQGQPTYAYTFGGALQYYGQNWTFGAPPSAWGDSLTIVALEHDINVSFTMQANSSVVDSFIFGNSDSNNHRGVTLVANQTSSLALAGAFSSTSNPMFYVLQLGIGVRKSDSESPSGTTNPTTQIPYRFGGWITAPPMANETVMMHVVTDSFTLPTNFTGSVGYCGNAPSTAFSMSVQKNGLEFGKINVDTNKVVTFTGTATQLAVNDVITVVATASDAAIANVAWTFKGVTV